MLNLLLVIAVIVLAIEIVLGWLLDRKLLLQAEDIDRMERKVAHRLVSHSI